MEKKFKISFDFRKYWTAFLVWFKAHVRLVSVVSSCVVFLLLVELVVGVGMPETKLPWSVMAAVRSAGDSALDSVVGIVEPYQSGTVYAKTSGRIASVFKQAGDMANAGDLLITISNPSAVSALTELSESLNQAKESLRKSLIGAAPAVINAPASGRLVLLSAEKGASMSGGAVALIAIDGLYVIDFAVFDSLYEVGSEVLLRGGSSGIAETSGTVAEVQSDYIVVSTDYEGYMPGNTVKLIGIDGNTAADGIVEVAKPALVFGVSGVIADVKAREGANVAAGDPLFTLEGPLAIAGHDGDFEDIEKQMQALAEAQETVDALSVYAPFDGVVSSIDIQAGLDIAKGQAAITMTNPDMRKVALRISAAINPATDNELYAKFIDALPKVGQTITLTSAEGAVFEALVESIESMTDALYINCAIKYSEELHLGSELIYELPLSEELQNEASGIVKEAVSIGNDAVIIADGETFVLREPLALPLALKLRGPIGRLFHPSSESLLEYVYEECLTPVEIIEAEDGGYVVLNGLASGDRYIVPYVIQAP
jgi:multidrug efflux pump subunit AcrA (membrane-fusion protein)